MKKEYIIYIAVAVVIVVGIATYLLLNTGSCSACGATVSQSQVQSLQQIANNNTLANKIGLGVLAEEGTAAYPKVINATPYIVDGKPQILYVGGEFCPYCGVTRWGLILALMRFGNFTNLTYMESSPTDVYANTHTFSFINASYKSNLIHFNGLEVTNREEQNNTAVNFTPEDQLIDARYSDGGGIPFIDFSNDSAVSGAVVNPVILKGQNWNQIIAALGEPNTSISQAIIGNANLFTAYICKSNETLNSTAAACKEPYVKSIIG
jgi:hypothetical protein